MISSQAITPIRKWRILYSCMIYISFSVLIFLSDAGSRLPNVTILLPTEKKQVDIDEKEKTLKLAGR